jgi:hypothetical protein
MKATEFSNLVSDITAYYKEILGVEDLNKAIPMLKQQLKYELSTNSGVYGYIKHKIEKGEL